MRKSLLVGVAFGAMTAASVAQAADPVPVPVGVAPIVVAPAAASSPQWYVTLFGGFALKANVDGQYYGSSNLDLQANHGFLLGGAFGTWLTPGFRTEIEIATTRRSVSDPNFMYEGWCGIPDPYCDANGRLNTLYVLGNAWFHPFNMGRISPYIGIGAGMAVLKPNISLYEGGGYDPFYYAWDDRRIAAAAQLGVGAQFDLNDRLTIDASYRMRAVLGGVFANGTYPSCSRNCSAVGITYFDHGLQLGVTLGF
ncbi:MAG: outer membrane beta-barrel protein [Bauldia sp.]|nr:outer membrane beta-barrel protein [Bauldia sp.]